MPAAPHPPDQDTPGQATDIAGRHSNPARFGPRPGAVVLVHGAWVGDWCWAPLLPPLRATGREVHTVALRGHGSRRADSGPHVTLDDHVTDLVDHIEAWDLVEIVLVAHSYGGRVASRALPQLAARVGHVVYLDAHAPLLAAGESETADGRDGGAAPAGDGMVPFGEFPPDPGEFGTPEAVNWFLDRTVAQSAATLREPWEEPIPEHVGCTYVHATGDGPSRFTPYAAAARRDPRWRYVEVACSHWLMIARPTEVAAIIDDAA